MNYVQEIADTFLERCHSAETLGPDDFTLIAEWEKQEIPREVVIDAIMLLATPSTRSVTDLRGGVKELFVEWLRSERLTRHRRAA
jgi:hypothetical protein